MIEMSPEAMADVAPTAPTIARMYPETVPVAGTLSHFRWRRHESVHCILDLSEWNALMLCRSLHIALPMCSGWMCSGFMCAFDDSD